MKLKPSFSVAFSFTANRTDELAVEKNALIFKVSPLEQEVYNHLISLQLQQGSNR